MAGVVAAAALSAPARLSLASSSSSWSLSSLPAVGGRRCVRWRPVRCTASDGNQVGDIGARDPYPGEIESNFGSKTLGNADTEHRKLIPLRLATLGQQQLNELTCSEQLATTVLDSVQARKLLRQVDLWDLKQDDAGTPVLLTRRYTVGSFKKGLELFARVGAMAEKEGHHPDLHLEGYNNVVVETSTHSAGGLTENDFILAAKIEALDVSDLIKKKKQKFWA
eukprot:jgi/Chlat1/3583/Chrsp234S03563